MRRYDTPPYYITAYGLAVKHGFKGTEEEWLASLHAKEIEIRYLDGMLQWRRVPNESEKSDTLTGEEETEGEAEDLYAWHDLIDIAGIRGEVIEQAMAEAIAAAETAKSEAAKVEGTREIAVDARNMADRNADDIEYISKNKLPQTKGAKVGQYLQITEVDAEGRAIKVKPVDAPSGGYGGGDLDMKGCGVEDVGSLDFKPIGDGYSQAFWMQAGSDIKNADGSQTAVAEFYSSESDLPVVLRHIANGMQDDDAVNVGQLKTRLLAPIKAAVGQYIQITAVDENGVVTAVEAVDAPSGGGGADEVFVKLEDGTVASAEVEFDLSDANTPALVVSPNTAEVGQTIVVEEVDEGGKPTKWKAIDLPAGGSESGWSKLGDVIISDAYEYEMLSAENGVITIDASSNHYDYLNSESGVRCLVIPKDITVKEQPKIIHLKVNDFTAGVFEIWNADNSQQITDSFDVAKYKLSANNIANIVLENIPDRDNYKLRVTTPVINVNGLRDYFECRTMTGLSLEACSIINSTGGCIIEIEATICPYDERYYYKRTKVLWGKQYGGSGQETFDAIHIKPAGVGANKPKDGKVAIASYWMMFTNGTRFELWGANDA